MTKSAHFIWIILAKCAQYKKTLLSLKIYWEVYLDEFKISPFLSQVAEVQKIDTTEFWKPQFSEVAVTF